MADLSVTSAGYTVIGTVIADRPKKKFAELRGYRAIALELDRAFAEPVAVPKQRTMPFGIERALALVARVMPIS